MYRLLYISFCRKKPSFCGVKNYGNVINDVYEKGVLIIQL